MAPMWNLDDSLSLVRALQSTVKQFGYHVALGGGVLNKGTSDKDVDLYFLPLDNKKLPVLTDKLVNYLNNLWGSPEVIGKEYEEEPPDNLVPNGPEYIQAAPHHWFVEDVDITTPAQRFRAPLTYTVSTTRKAMNTTVYKYKLKYTRSNNDRIDVFIL